MIVSLLLLPVEGIKLGISEDHIKIKQDFFYKCKCNNKHAVWNGQLGLLYLNCPLLRTSLQTVKTLCIMFEPTMTKKEGRPIIVRNEN